MAYQFPAGMSAQQKNRIVDSFCAQYNYPSTPIAGTTITGDGSNADRTRFFQYQVRKFVHSLNRSQRGEAAAQQARLAAMTAADADAELLD